MKEFYLGMADILEASPAAIAPSFDLHSGEAAWDSLAIISTIALADDCFGVALDGRKLAECKLIEDIENLIKDSKKG